MFHDGMHVAVGTIARPTNSLGVVAALCGVAGALLTGILWLYQQRPNSPLLGQYGYEIAHGGPLREDLVLLAGLLGAVAIIAAMLSSIGGATRASAIAALLLGAVALTFPIMVWLDMVGTPLRVALFPGS
jgi:hypothetical protein